MAGALSMLVACGSRNPDAPDAHNDDPASLPPPTVRGAYAPRQPNEATVWSEFIAVDFLDGEHFAVMRARPCADGSSGRDACLVRGTYTMTHDRLTLNDPTDPTGTLASFSITKTTPAETGTTGTHFQTALIEGAAELLPGLARELMLADSEGRGAQLVAVTPECMKGVTGNGANCGAKCDGGYWCIRYPASRIGVLQRTRERNRCG
jgi:hypothetical protein